MLQSSFVRSLLAALLILSGLLITPFAAQASKISAAQQTVILSINDIVAVPGATGTLQIDLNNVAGPPVFAGQITINYTSAIGLNLTSAQLTNRASGFVTSFSQPSANQVQILFYNTSGQTISPGTGSIIDVGYTVTASAAGSTALSFTQALLSGTTGANIATNTDNGLFTVNNGTPGNARIYIQPASSNINVGDTQILQVMVDPGNAAVNGVQINGKVDPAYLNLLSVQNNTSLLTTVLEAVAFDASTGAFSYSAGRLNGTVNTIFEILRLEVLAVAATGGTAVEFLNTFPQTDITDADGSVMDSADNGVIVIDSAPINAVLIGEIGLQGRPSVAGPYNAVPVTIELLAVGGTTPVSTFNVTLDQNRRFTQGAIIPGIYDIRMVNNHTLVSRVQNVQLSAGSNNIYLGPLREGDVVQDNEVRVNDFGVLAGAFNLCNNSSSSFNPQTDLNEDDCTDIDDFSLLSGNFNTQGDITYDVNSPPPLPLELATATMELQTPNVAGKAAGETFEAILFVDPKGSRVNGATAHIQFDPAILEVVEVTLLANEELPTALQESEIDNDAGTVSFSKGALGSTVSKRFELAKLTLRLKQETDGASLAFSDAFPANNVTGKEGSVLAETIVEETVTDTDTNTDTETTPPAVPDAEGQTAKDTSEAGTTSTDERVFLPLILR